jgi:FixJ family two-component response regulator
MPVIFLTGHANIRTAVIAMQNGALNFLEKPPSYEELREAIYHAVWIDREKQQSRLHRSRIHSLLATLTIKEEYVLEMIGAGMSTRQVASELDLSVRTVELRRAKIIQKLELESLAHLERLAFELHVQCKNGNSPLTGREKSLQKLA